MIRMIGAGLILFSTMALGNRIAFKYIQIPKILHQVEVLLEMVGSEIKYAAVPLPDLLSRVSNRFSNESGKIFSYLNAYLTEYGLAPEEAFKLTKDELENQICLEQEDWEILENLTVYLGKSDSEEQVKQIELCLTHIRANQKIAIEERRKNERMWRYLGVLTGLMLIILIW